MKNLYTKHFQYIADLCAWSNSHLDPADVIAIVEAGRFSEGFYIVYAVEPARQERIKKRNG